MILLLWLIFTLGACELKVVVEYPGETGLDTGEDTGEDTAAATRRSAPEDRARS